MDALAFPAQPEIKYLIDIGKDNSGSVSVMLLNSIGNLDHTTYCVYIFMPEFDTDAMTQAKRRADESIRENEKRRVPWNEWEV